jgi:hypothetical protein
METQNKLKEDEYSYIIESDKDLDVRNQFSTVLLKLGIQSWS